MAVSSAREVVSPGCLHDTEAGMARHALQDVGDFMRHHMGNQHRVDVVFS
jgi:hypothetical protein